MRRRTRHTLILLGVTTLLLLALGGWIVDAARKPFTLRRRASRSLGFQRAGIHLPTSR